MNPEHPEQTRRSSRIINKNNQEDEIDILNTKTPPELVPPNSTRQFDSDAFPSSLRRFDGSPIYISNGTSPRLSVLGLLNPSTEDNTPTGPEFAPIATTTGTDSTYTPPIAATSPSTESASTNTQSVTNTPSTATKNYTRKGSNKKKTTPKRPSTEKRVTSPNIKLTDPYLNPTASVTSIDTNKAKTVDTTEYVTMEETEDDVVLTDTPSTNNINNENNDEAKKLINYCKECLGDSSSSYVPFSDEDPMNYSQRDAQDSTYTDTIVSKINEQPASANVPVIMAVSPIESARNTPQLAPNNVHSATITPESHGLATATEISFSKSTAAKYNKGNKTAMQIEANVKETPDQALINPAKSTNVSTQENYLEESAEQTQVGVDINMGSGAPCMHNTQENALNDLVIDNNPPKTPAKADIVQETVLQDETTTGKSTSKSRLKKSKQADNAELPTVDPNTNAFIKKGGAKNAAKAKRTRGEKKSQKLESNFIGNTAGQLTDDSTVADSTTQPVLPEPTYVGPTSKEAGSLEYDANEPCAAGSMKSATKAQPLSIAEAHGLESNNPHDAFTGPFCMESADDQVAAAGAVPGNPDTLKQSLTGPVTDDPAIIKLSPVEHSSTEGVNLCRNNHTKNSTTTGMAPVSRKTELKNPAGVAAGPANMQHNTDIHTASDLIVAAAVPAAAVPAAAVPAAAVPAAAVPAAAVPAAAVPAAAEGAPAEHEKPGKKGRTKSKKAQPSQLEKFKETEVTDAAAAGPSSTKDVLTEPTPASPPNAANKRRNKKLTTAELAGQKKIEQMESPNDAAEPANIEVSFVGPKKFTNTRTRNPTKTGRCQVDTSQMDTSQTDTAMETDTNNPANTAEVLAAPIAPAEPVHTEPASGIFSIPPARENRSKKNTENEMGVPQKVESVNLTDTLPDPTISVETKVSITKGTKRGPKKSAETLQESTEDESTPKRRRKNSVKEKEKEVITMEAQSINTHPVDTLPKLHITETQKEVSNLRKRRSATERVDYTEPPLHDESEESQHVPKRARTKSAKGKNKEVIDKNLSLDANPVIKASNTKAATTKATRASKRQSPKSQKAMEAAANTAAAAAANVEHDVDEMDEVEVKETEIASSSTSKPIKIEGGEEILELGDDCFEKLLTSKSSHLATADLRTLIPQWLNAVSPEDRQEIAKHLPVPDQAKKGKLITIKEGFDSPSNNFFWEAVEQWQDILSIGGFEKTAESSIKKDFKDSSFKDENYENYWGERLKRDEKSKTKATSSRGGKARGRGRGRGRRASRS